MDSAFPEPLLVVNGAPIQPIGPAPAPTYDTLNSCDYPGLTTFPVNIKYADDKCWSWSTWTWSPSAGLASTTGVNNVVDITRMAGPTTYTITGTDSAMNMFSCNHRVMYLTVIPCFNASNNGPICEYDTLKLYCHGDSIGATYAWTGPTGFTSTLQNPIRYPVTVADSGIYTVIRYLSGKYDTTTTHVVIKPQPHVVAGSNSPICSQTTLSLTATFFAPGETFAWTGPNSFASGIENPTVASAATAYTGLYKVRTALNGCFDSSYINVRVDSTPAIPTPNSNSPICSHRDTLKLRATDATAGVSYSWSASTGYASFVQNPIILPDVPVTPTGGLIYSVTATLGACKSSFSTVVFVRKTPDVPLVASNSPVCTGDTIKLYATSDPGVTYKWRGPLSFGPTAQNPTIQPAAVANSGIYSVSATQFYTGIIGGCISDTAIIHVVVDSAVTSAFNYDIHWGCKADTVVFDNRSTVATTYVWQFGDGTSSIDSDPTHVYITQDSFKVKLISLAGACRDSSKATIQLIHPLHAAFTADVSLLCQGAAVTFSDASVGTAPTVYYWNFGDGGTSAAPSPVHTFPRTGIYNVYEVVSDYVPCYDTAFHVITVDSTSPVSIRLTDTVLCAGTAVTLTANYTSIGNTGIVWDFGNGDSIKNVNPVSYGYQTPGTYVVTATARYRICEEPVAKRTITITPQPTLNLGADTTICKGSGTVLLADNDNLGKPGVTWLWNTGETTRGITVTEPGIYYETVSIGGCQASDTVQVFNDCYINIPNIFTPNGDGVNDYFFPRDYLTRGLVSFKIVIYNRWGQVVFESTSLEGRGWDGNLNGVPQPEGVFIYMIDGTFKDGQKEHHQGNITLLR